jgi:hypothetical protein
MRVKFFAETLKGPVWSRSDPVADLEKAVNAWLAENPSAKVIAVHQSAAGGSLNPAAYLVSVWYEPGP